MIALLTVCKPLKYVMDFRGRRALRGQGRGRGIEREVHYESPIHMGVMA